MRGMAEGDGNMAMRLMEVGYKRVRGGFMTSVCVQREDGAAVLEDGVMFVKLKDFPRTNKGFQDLEEKVWDAFAPVALERYGVDVSRTRYIDL